jgi:hypothetical protein
MSAPFKVLVKAKLVNCEPQKLLASSAGKFHDSHFEKAKSLARSWPRAWTQRSESSIPAVEGGQTLCWT